MSMMTIHKFNYNYNAFSYNILAVLKPKQFNSNESTMSITSTFYYN
jgi:hypothetical protein